tara:strand:+ start:56 stop:691 length:636 start_codon:yes stop_codon:yes gene_type:complete
MQAHIIGMTNESEQVRALREREEGSIGIGAMIVFIALILVAAVASTIIITTAEELQQRAEKTADDTRGEISGKINIVDAFVKTNAAGPPEVVASILLIAQLAAGADEVTSNLVTYFITCANAAEDDLVIDTSNIDDAGAAMLDNSDGDGNDDTAFSSDELESGDTFKIPITLTNCQPAVGGKLQVLITVDGGGETEAELEVVSTTVGKSLV